MTLSIFIVVIPHRYSEKYYDYNNIYMLEVFLIYIITQINGS